MINGHVIENFIHREGVHCESSAMRDVFEFVGFPMSEAMAFGLDATMGFGYFDTSNSFTNIMEGEIPFFLGGKQGTIMPNSLACRLLGINLRKQSFTSADKAWEESKIIIDQNIPLIIQCDMFYLDYFDLEEGIHFGGHTITLGGYDENKGVVYVGDTEFEGFQEITIETLKIARSSEHGPTFMHPKNAQYSMVLKEKRPPFAAAVKVAIQEVCKNMLRPSMSHTGLQGLQKFADSVINWEDELKGIITNPNNGKRMNKAKMMFELVYGYIEDWGTGGSCFRKIYLDFLKELQDHPDLKAGPRAWNQGDYDHLAEAVPIMETVVNDWKNIADAFKSAADEYKENCLEHLDYSFVQDLASGIARNEENAFTVLSKIKN